jgi:hypothetical protein
VNAFFAGLVGRATQGGPVLERRPRSRFEPGAHRGPAAGAAPADRDELDVYTDGGTGGDPPGARRREPATGHPPVRVPPLDGAPAQALLALRSPGAPAMQSGPARLVQADSVLARPAEPDGENDREIDAEPGPVARLEPALTARSTASAAIPLRPVDRLAHGDAPGPGSPASGPPRRPIRAVVAPPATWPSPAEAAAVTPISRGARPAAPAASGSAPAAPSGFTPPAPRDAVAQPVRSAVPGVQALRALPALLAPRAVGSPARETPAPIVRSTVDRGPRSNGPAAPPPAPVHVTIGRIEVRATTPAADRPPVRRPAPQPRLSLEDYLSGRRGGAR